jgi:hypothetical protein
MNNNKSSGGSKGLGFMSVLTLAFIVLKLCGVIHWSWLWVLSPLWIQAVVIILVLIWFFNHIK